MRQDKKLILGMALLFFITFVSLGTLVITEKLAPFYTDRIQTKIEDYIQENYEEEKENLELGKIAYKTPTYKVKVSNKKNSNLYFTITYENNEIKDTYKTDYLEGKTLLSSIEKELEEKIEKELNLDTTITFPLTLDQYTNQIRKNIINNKLENINIYNIELSINGQITQNNINGLVTNIENNITKIKGLNINPNYYTINITSKRQGRTLTIEDLTDNTLQSETLAQVITYILSDDETKAVTNSDNILTENHLSYEYRKYGDE